MVKVTIYYSSDIEHWKIENILKVLGWTINSQSFCVKGLIIFSFRSLKASIKNLALKERLKSEKF